MFQLLTSPVTDGVMEYDVDSDVIVEQRRSASGEQMTSEQTQQLTDAHNSRRRSVRATNMELMVL